MIRKQQRKITNKKKINQEPNKFFSYFNMFVFVFD
jgi:hypothetical protein